MSLNTSYFNTFLTTQLAVHPKYMDNNIKKHIKAILIETFQDKCLNHYGYIYKIYKIEEMSNGILVPEDLSVSALFNIKFSCKLCRPLKNTVIICEVIGINRALIYLRNGPIYILVLEGGINSEKFIFDDKHNVLLYQTNKSIGTQIVKGSYVKIKMVDARIEHNAKRITAMGILDDIATPEEVAEMISQKESDAGKFISYEKYVGNEVEQRNLVASVD